MCVFGQEEKKHRENVYIHYKEIFQRDNRMLENDESCESVKSLTFNFFLYYLFRCNLLQCSVVTCFSVSNFVFIFNISFDIHNNQYHCKDLYH